MSNFAAIKKVPVTTHEYHVFFSGKIHKLSERDAEDLCEKLAEVLGRTTSCRENDWIYNELRQDLQAIGAPIGVGTTMGSWPSLIRIVNNALMLVEIHDNP